MAAHADDRSPGPDELTLAQVAAHAGVSPATVGRWVQKGLVPGYEGRWTKTAAAYVRVVARLRARGHTLEQIKRASDNGQLAIGPIENLLSGLGGSLHAPGGGPRGGPGCGPDPAHLRRLGPERAARGCVLRRGRAGDEVRRPPCWTPGFPPAAYLQLARVYGQAIAKIADAEVRLLHLYVHEPLMRAGVGGVEIAEQMEGLARDTLPFAAPVMNFMHGRFLAYFVEQDLIGHMEAASPRVPPRRGGCGSRSPSPTSPDTPV